MARRRRVAQTAHDKGVRAEAKELEKKGWTVRADVSGWPTPRTVNGRRPDVIATKRGSGRIVEIETDADDDHNQHTAFRRHVGQKDNWVFYGWIVDAAGRRRRRFR